MTNTLPQKIFRNTEPEYAKAFVEGGEIMFRSLTYYRNIEDETRQDDHEGKFVQSIAGLPIEFDDNGELPLNISFEVGSFTRCTDSADHIHISCYSLAHKPKLGQTTIEIFDVRGFINQVCKTLKPFSLELECGRINYYDPNSKLEGGDVDKFWLEKRQNPYKIEEEYRIKFYAIRKKFYEECFPAHFGDGSAKVPDYMLCKCGNLEKFARLL